MDAYMRGAAINFLDNFIRLNAGHIKIVPEEASGNSRLLPLEQGITDISRVLEIIEDNPSIEVAAPRIQYGVLLEKPGGIIPAIGIALVPSLESKLLNLEEYLISGTLPSDSDNSILLGSELAEDLELTLHDEMFIVASDVYGSCLLYTSDAADE